MKLAAVALFLSERSTFAALAICFQPLERFSLY